MQLFDYITLTELKTKVQADQAKLLCFYHYKDNGERTFTASRISEIMVNAGFNAPNTSRLKDSFTKGKGKAFLFSKTNKGLLDFIPTVLQELEIAVGQAWSDTTTIVSDSELIDEVKFCGKRHYISKLITQINHCYANNCYDACAVLMRRLFEVLLILSYQNLSIDDDIKDSTGAGYIMLDVIVKNAKNNVNLKLSRIKNEFDAFRMVGNFSAHNITYTAGKKDIDDIKLNYRVMLEELFSKAGLTL